jgi:hypothetical protein
MIKSLTVTNYLGDSLKIELGRPETSGFLVRNITGLGPPKADINSTELVTSDGALYNSSRVQTRNLVIHLDFLMKPTVEAVRILSYKYFPVKKFVKIKMETDSRVAEVSGYVESNEPDIFSKKEGTQISIICPDPYFYSENENIVTFSGFESLFEFEFSNESLDTPLITMGEISTVTTNIVEYYGDAEVGLLMILKASGPVENPMVVNLNTNESIRIDSAKMIALTGSDIVAGDEIRISTVRNNKFVVLLRNGLYTNILNTLDRDTDWFTLAKGDNEFAYFADDGLLNLYFEIRYRMVYEGV